jgi:hypothetical protein
MENEESNLQIGTWNRESFVPEYALLECVSNMSILSIDNIEEHLEKIGLRGATGAGSASNSEQIFEGVAGWGIDFNHRTFARLSSHHIKLFHDLKTVHKISTSDIEFILSERRGRVNLRKFGV